jgi:ASC-1-like (ASCH) protein
MAKGTNAKIKELKGVKPEKITDEQLEKVQQLVNSINRGQLEVGAMELQKHENMHGVTLLRVELEALQSELEKQYGTIDIDIKNGTINYPENGEVNS